MLHVLPKVSRDQLGRKYKYKMVRGINALWIKSTVRPHRLSPPCPNQVQFFSGNDTRAPAGCRTAGGRCGGEPINIRLPAGVVVTSPTWWLDEALAEAEAVGCAYVEGRGGAAMVVSLMGEDGGGRGRCVYMRAEDALTRVGEEGWDRLRAEWEGWRVAEQAVRWEEEQQVEEGGDDG